MTVQRNGIYAFPTYQEFKSLWQMLKQELIEALEDDADIRSAIQAVNMANGRKSMDPVQSALV